MDMEVKLSAVKKLIDHKAVDPWQDVVAPMAADRLVKQGKNSRRQHPYRIMKLIYRGNIQW